jgi:uncharacterized protein
LRAAENGDERVVKLLLENGAQPDFKDEKGQTPLSRAVEKGGVAVIQLLLAKDVKMDFKYNIVSERHPYLSESTRLMADSVIFDYCRM